MSRSEPPSMFEAVSSDGKPPGAGTNRDHHELMGKVSYMGDAGKGQSAKLTNQVTVASTVVGLVEGIVYAHKAGVDVGVYLDAIVMGATGSKFLDAYGKRMLKRDLKLGSMRITYLEICLKDA